MDFLTVARMLMDIQKEYPNMRYDFVNGTVVLYMGRIEDDVPKLFEDMATMMEPI